MEVFIVVAVAVGLVDGVVWCCTCVVVTVAPPAAPIA